MPSLPESLAVLRQRDFRLLFCGQAVSVLGDRMVAVALAFAVLELGGSASAVGLVLACRTLPLVGCLLIGGVVADRTSRRAVMVAADLVRLASHGVLAALLIAGAAEVWIVALLAGVAGAATGFFMPASTGLLPSIVAPDRLQQANGLRATAMATGEIAGPAIAGVLVASAGAGWAIGVDAATFGVSAVFLARLRLPARVARAAGSFLADVREGWTEVRTRTWVWTFVASASAGNMLSGAWSVLGPVVADRDLGGAAAWGAVLAMLGVGAMIGGVVAIRIRPRRPLVVSMLAASVMCVPFALLASGVSAPIVALGATLYGGGLFLSNALWESTLQRHIPDESLSRVSSYDWFGSLAFQPLGMAIWGPIAAGIGIETSLWLATGLWLVTILSVFAVPDVRHLPAGPAADADGVAAATSGSHR